VGTIQFAGLAPGLAGLYQINVQVPSTGLVAGDNVYVEFTTDFADVNQIQIPFGSGSASTAIRPVRTPAEATRIAARRTEGRKPASQVVRGGVAKGRCEAAVERAGTTKGCIQ
jgi:hypothetical protein